jgi:hypothetical protein
MIFRFALVILLQACSLSGPLREDPVAQNFSMGPMGIQWVQVEAQNSNGKSFLYYKNPSSGATFFVNSVCERYKDSKLKTLMEQLKAPLSKTEIVSEQEKMLDGRNSLWTRVAGEVDGVRVENLFVVIRKNSCLFDFTLSALKQIEKNDLERFTAWVDGFSYKGE